MIGGTSGNGEEITTTADGLGVDLRAETVTGKGIATSTGDENERLKMHFWLIDPRGTTSTIDVACIAF